MITELLLKDIIKTENEKWYHNNNKTSRFKIINELNIKIIEYETKYPYRYDISIAKGGYHELDGYKKIINIYKIFDVDEYTIQNIIFNYINLRDSFYWNYDKYKYKLFILLKKALGKDMAVSILKMMIYNNKTNNIYYMQSLRDLYNEYRYKDCNDNSKRIKLIDDLFDLMNIQSIELTIKN